MSSQIMLMLYELNGYSICNYNININNAMLMHNYWEPFWNLSDITWNLHLFIHHDNMRGHKIEN